jgi:Ca-activated chloride channel homolog
VVRRTLASSSAPRCAALTPASGVWWAPPVGFTALVLHAAVGLALVLPATSFESVGSAADDAATAGLAPRPEDDPRAASAPLPAIEGSGIAEADFSTAVDDLEGNPLAEPVSGMTDGGDRLMTMSTGGGALAGAIGLGVARGSARGAAKAAGRLGRGDRLAIIVSDDAAGAPVHEDARMEVRRADGETGRFALEHTHVEAAVSGYVAAVDVEQRFVNVYDETVEAEYVFPLPAQAAVTDFVMEIEGRRTIGIVRRRAEAEAIYAAARARGHTASILRQERPNVFTQRVANVPARGRVRIALTYCERLVFDDGWYRFAFPMAVRARHHSGDGAPSDESCRFTCGDPSQTPAADATIAPRFAAPSEHELPGHGVSLALAIRAPFPISLVECETHRIDQDLLALDHRVVRLAADERLANRDFVCRWRVAGDALQAGMLAHADSRGGFFTLMVQPPLDPGDKDVTPRELTFILDTSGSMAGLPLSMSKAIIEYTLEKLRPGDFFNIVRFAGDSGQLFDRPQGLTDSALEQARAFLEGASAAGGTGMLGGLERALAAAHEPSHLQMYVFLTDGLIDDEDEILRLIARHSAAARFFAFGAGSSVNRHLIDGVGRLGGGEAQYANPGDATDSVRCVHRFLDAIEAPVLVEPTIDWNGLPVAELEPARPRDLFAGRTLAITGRYTRPAEGIAYVEGRVGSRRVRLPVAVSLPERGGCHPALPAIWARARISTLADELAQATERQEREHLATQIQDVALEFHLASAFTSFVAVDESAVRSASPWAAIAVPAAAAHVAGPIEK